MAVPVAGGFLAAMGGVLLAVLASRIGYILAALGIGIASYVGVTVIALELVDLLNDYGGGLSAITVMGIPAGDIMQKILQRAGFFTALNIIIAAYLTKISIVAAAIHLRRIVAP